MCHVNVNESNNVTSASHPWISHGVNQPQQSKSTLRLSPFKRVAKSARVNLNRYWGMLNLKSSKTTPETPVKSQPIDEYSEEEMQNRMNELLEAQANAEEQNSINTQIEENSPVLPRTLFVRQRKLSLHSVNSSTFSSVSSHHHYHQSDMEMDFDDSCSQYSVFL